MTRARFFGIWLMPLAIAVDRALKAFAGRMTGARALIPGVIGARYAENTGAAFSMFSSFTLPLAVITAALIAGVTLYLLLGKNIPRLARCALWLVVAGGLSNLYDRIFIGFVIDYFELLFIDFAIFNFADACVCVGAALAFISLCASEGKKQREA